MAEEKKPKIDLKARLGKGAAGAATPPPGAVGIPAPAPGGLPGAAPAPSPAAPSSTRGSSVGVPVPPGVPVGPPPGFKAPALDPSNPLAAVAAPAPSVRPAAPPQPQRIEVDEAGLQQARKGALKQGLIGGAVGAVVLGVIGYIIGGASAESKAREVSSNHAKSLVTDVDAAQAKLKELADKVEEGRGTLLKGKFPDSLAKDLGAINVDFDGSKLAGVRFSGFSNDTTTGLIEFITAVQATNDRKNALVSLLGKLQKPLTEQLEGGATPKIQFVAIIDKDSARQPFAILAGLTSSIDVKNQNAPQLPAEFVATNPLTRGNVTVPKLTSVDKPGAVYVIPKSIEAACPSETSGLKAQLGGQLNRVITDIRGEQAAPDVISDTKAGLLERAAKLSEGLKKVR